MADDVADDAEVRNLRKDELRLQHYPETSIDGFSRIDNGVEFYTRVNALLRSDMVAVDYGAGRGRWYHDSDSAVRTDLRMMQGKVAKVIGLDVDPAVTTNPTLDEAHVIAVDRPLPLADESVDVVVSDWTFEHIANPDFASAELHRVLRPGGWVCARTPNKWGYIGIGSRSVPNQWHVSWLTRLQPHRKDVDVFPVTYELNTPRDVARHFTPDKWRNIVYTLPAEPAYAGASAFLWSAFRALQHVQPRSLDPVLAIFLQKL